MKLSHRLPVAAATLLGVAALGCPALPPAPGRARHAGLGARRRAGRDWTAIDPNDLLVIDLAGGGRVVILLADAFAPVHVGQHARLAAAHWYDGLAIERVQDNYVVQWGDPDGKKPLPTGIAKPAPAEYERAGRRHAAHAAALSRTPTPTGWASSAPCRWPRRGGGPG